MITPFPLPNWLKQSLNPLLSVVLGIGAFAVASFFSNMQEQRTQNLKLQILDVRVAKLEAIAEANSEFRLKNGQQWEDFRATEWPEFKEQYKKDMATVIAGHAQILTELHRHEEQTRH